MGIVSAFMALVFLGSAVMLFMPLAHDDGLEWGALFPIALGGFGAWYTFGMARYEYRAKKLRRERGAPEPGAGHVSQ
ncbi:hypothetical protein QF038_001038 [Pseudarthrobacter sp. W1I19]|uniref:hypothetical protein n=1 Tax=Pseudarthrobacter sp. W1I19 TaxID=3042288 RepID=UPI0027897C8E|nr:hypothetical protein [Pseudarthrobacter sp. W1I19]MDQ0922530.1 hypothetical protein [Pseudarthrobacter sp. W1I19]